MEEAARKEHGLMLENRKAGKITGVVDVISFDPESVLLETSEGMLTIKGRELHVSRLHLEKGEVDLEGLFQSLVYSDDGDYARRQKGSLVKRLFK